MRLMWAAFAKGRLEGPWAFNLAPGNAQQKRPYGIEGMRERFRG
jgi:hypothetical protein